MSATSAAYRRKSVLTLAGIAVGLWVILGLTSLSNGAQGGAHDRLGEPVLEGFSETRADAQRIRFTLVDDSYTLVRSASGWLLEETGGYPIRADRLSDLAGGLETLAFDERRTDDPYKHDRIGLGDPTEGRNGALIEIFGSSGDLENSLIIGRKNDTLYVRAPDDAQTYRADGTLPPFYNRRGWLDLNIINIDPSAIRSVRIMDANGEMLYLRRAEGSDARSFRPAPPNQDDVLISRLAASTTALAATRLSPSDVKPISDLVSEPIARHISETFDGLEVDLRAYREPTGFWVTLRAVEAGEGARRAEAINEKAEGWAFRITDYDFQDFTPAVSSIVERAP
ncbi:MAG: DUF4340 domain-containing protein [Henriciella sp.]|nr:DUF4340 domain-containing protein [Henriciella sp.]